MRVSIAILFLLSLWIYQLPHSPVERLLMRILGPVPELTFTNRQYRMYAPEPRSSKNFPSIALITSHQEVIAEGPPSLPKLSQFSREKWMNVIDYMAKPPFSQGPFERLARRYCDENVIVGGEKIVRVESRIQPVDFEKMRVSPEWGEIEELASYDCDSSVLPSTGRDGKSL